MSKKTPKFFSTYDDVDEELHPFLDNWFKNLDQRPVHEMSAQEVRDRLDSLGKGTRPPRPDTVRVEDTQIQLEGRTLPIRIYRPAAGNAPFPVMLYFHGGGWTLGGLDTHHDPFLCFYTEISGVAIVTVDYRLSPEHKHPAQVNDAYDSLIWLRENATKLGFDPDRIGVGGDSAGGHLAAATTLIARDKGGPALCFQLIIYPALDSNFERYSWWRYKDGPILTRDWQIWCWRNWQEGPEPVHDPISYPLQAESLEGLPPAHMMVAEVDVLLDEAVDYAHRLLDAGVPTTLQICRRLPHGFQRALHESARVKHEMHKAGEAIRRGFQK